MINLKGYRRITVDGIPFRFKCTSHEKTSVYHEASNSYFVIQAANSGEVNRMSLPSVVSASIRDTDTFQKLKTAQK